MSKDLKKRIVEFIKKRGNGVSFVELEREFKEEMAGNLDMYLEHYNIVFWVCMNEGFVRAINELRAENKIITEPSTLMVYLIDGKTLTLPVAKSSRKYKKPRWLPVEFSLPK